MNEQRSSRQMGGMEGGDSSAQMLQRGGGIGGGSNLGSTMKLFASLGLSPSDLDALTKIPEEEISVETLPRILLQLKNRKREAEERRASSSDASYRGGREGWEEGNMGRMGSSSLSQGSARPQSSAGFGYSSVQDVSPGRGYDMNFSSSGGGGRDRPYSELSSHSGMGMGLGPSDPVFMQRRIGSPSNGKIQDFLGVLPSMYPHVCSLCDFDVHSVMEWNQHIGGLRHAENKRKLLNMYPEWEPDMASGGGGLLDPPNMSAGLLGPAPMSSGPMGGMSSNWGGGLGQQSSQNQLRTRVVVVRYDRKPLSDKTIFAFAKPFGRLSNHLILKNKAFLELSSADQAQDMVNYYMQTPALLYGKRLNFELSDRHYSIQDPGMMQRPAKDMGGHGSRVVFLNKLPREDAKKKQLLSMARRFGVVEKYLFLTDRAFIQLGTCEDAEMMVKYYTMNPLVMEGRLIRLNVCEKYKTLDVSRTRTGGGDSQNQRSSKDDSSSTTSRTRTSSTSKASSSIEKRSKEEKKEEDKEKSEEKPAVEKEEKEEEELLRGGDDDDDDEITEEQRAELLKDLEEETEEEKAHDATDEVPKEGGGTEADAREGPEPQGETGATETEASAEEPKTKDDSNVEAEGDIPEHMDMLENMEDFVTLDELEEDEGEGDSDKIDHSRRGGLRVVNIIGIRRGHNYLNEMLRLAEPFGKVVKHLVLDLRPEAFLQFTTEEEARAMAKFYNSNVTAMVCGRPVRVSHSMNYPTIKCGSSKVVYIGKIPGTKYSDEAILKLAEPYGKIKKYFLNRIKKECFIEMERVEDAEKMAESCKKNLPLFNGKRLTIYISRKYRQLKYGHLCPNLSKRASSPSPKSEEPPAKKQKEEPKPEEEEVVVKEKQPGEDEEIEEQPLSGEEGMTAEEETVPEDSDEQKITNDEQKEGEQMETSTNQNGETEDIPAENKPDVTALPPYDPETPVGVEHVKKGYFCRVCFLFYSNEETAKKTHCSSQKHYDKLQKHLETEQAKSEETEQAKSEETEQALSEETEQEETEQAQSEEMEQAQSEEKMPE
ncbi:uncharacterized protein KZ484_009155 isoform 2-T3 [Pholidichthys leucotaenia]